ncbi:uncharacterized protein LOC120347787 isoform X1 [Styela clava]
MKGIRAHSIRSPAILFLICICVILFGTTYGELNTRKEGRRLHKDSNELSVSEHQNIRTSNATSRVSLIETSPISQINPSTDANQRSVQRRKDRQRKKSKHGRREKGNKRNGRKRKDNELNRGGETDINEVLRNTMRHMFGFDHIPVTTLPPVDAKPRTAYVDLDLTDSHTDYVNKKDIKSSWLDQNEDMMPQPPDFMLELYRTYSRDNNLMMLHSISQGNTVRSFFPSPADPSERSKIRKAVTIKPVQANTGATDGSKQTTETQRYESPFPVFLFNLSSIPRPETLVRAEIRLDGMTRSAMFMNQHNIENTQNETSLQNLNIVVGVYKIDSNDCADGLDCSVSSKIFHRIGNTTALNFDAVASWSARNLLRLATQARDRNHFLIVRFENRPDESLSRQIRHTEKESAGDDLPLQFMISENERLKRSSNRAKYNLDSSGSSLKEQWFDVNFDHSPETPILIIYCNDSRTALVKDTPSLAPSIIWRRLENMTNLFKKRVRRSEPQDIAKDEVDNRFVDEYDENNHGSTRRMQKTTPQVVEKYDSETKSENRKGKNVTKIKNIISNEKSGRKRRRNQKCNDGKKKGKRGCKKSSKGRKKQKKVPLHPSAVERDEDCGRKSMNVDFASIGWSDWIISPTTFEAYYCSGRCEISNMQVGKKTGTTNHAIVQAIARLAGATVPEPCCAPDKLMPLSVLFFDENSNVVLRVYTNMSVETCACK